MENVKKGDRVTVTSNDIFQMMGLDAVTGTFFCWHSDKSGFSMKCDQTGCIESVSLNDGEIEVVK